MEKQIYQKDLSEILKKAKLIGFIRLYNENNFDLSDIQVKINLKKITEKYGKENLVFVDEYNRILDICFENKSGDIVFDNKEWDGSYVWVKIPKITSKEQFFIFVFKCDQVSSKVSNIFDFCSCNEKELIKNLFFGSRLDVLEKYKWDYGHVQSILRLNENFYVSTVDIKEDKAYLFKLDVNTMEVKDSLDLTFGERYHPSGLCDDQVGECFYVAISEYKPKVTKPTLILRVYEDLSYEELFKVNDHVGAVCASKDRLYLFNWNAEKLYVYDLEGNLIKEVKKKGWGKIQDCDFSLGKIYATCQYEGRIDVIDTRSFNVVGRIYTGKGLTDEGFDIDHTNPSIFWLAPDDGFIYKCKYQAIFGYILDFKVSVDFYVEIESDEDIIVIFSRGDKIYVRTKVSNKIEENFEIYKGKNEYLLRITQNDINLSFNDVDFSYDLIDLKEKEVKLRIRGEGKIERIILRKYTGNLKYQLFVL